MILCCGYPVPALHVEGMLWDFPTTECSSVWVQALKRGMFTVLYAWHTSLSRPTCEQVLKHLLNDAITGSVKFSYGHNMASLSVYPQLVYCIPNSSGRATIWFPSRRSTSRLWWLATDLGRFFKRLFRRSSHWRLGREGKKQLLSSWSKLPSKYRCCKDQEIFLASNSIINNMLQTALTIYYILPLHTDTLNKGMLGILSSSFDWHQDVRHFQ